MNPITNPSAYDYVLLAGVRTPGIATVSDGGRPFKWDRPDAKGASGSSITYGGEDLATPKVTLTLWLPRHFTEWEAMVRLLGQPKAATGTSTSAAPGTTTTLSFTPLERSTFAYAASRIAAGLTTQSQAEAALGVDEKGAPLSVARFRAWQNGGVVASSSSSSSPAATSKNPRALDIYYPTLATNGITSVVVTKIGDLQPGDDGRETVEIELLEWREPTPAGGKPAGSAAKAPGGAAGDAGASVPQKTAAEIADDEEIAHLEAERDAAWEALVEA